MSDPETLLDIDAFDQFSQKLDETATPLIKLPTPKPQTASQPTPENSKPENSTPETSEPEIPEQEVLESIAEELVPLEPIPEEEAAEEEQNEDLPLAPVIDTELEIEELALGMEPIAELSHVDAPIAPPLEVDVEVEAESPFEVEVEVEVEATWSIRVRPIQGKEFVLALDGSTVTIGRADTNGISLDDRQLSRHHARIAVENGDWVVTDLASKNGTTVNGASVERCVLAHGDLILVGEAALVLDQEVELPCATVVAPTPAPVAVPAVEPVVETASTPAIDPNRLKVLLSFGEMLACAEDELGVLDEVVSRMRDVLRADRSVLFLVEEGQHKPLMQYASEDTRTGEPDAAAEAVMELAMAAEEPVTDSIVGAHARHVCIVPMHARYRKLGVLVIERGPAAEPFDEQDVRIASIAASQITTFLRSVL